LKQSHVYLTHLWYQTRKQMASKLSNDAAAIGSSSDPSPHPAPATLLTLPDDLLSTVLSFLTSFDLLELITLRAPCKSAIRAFSHCMSQIDIDLERDVGRAVREAEAREAEGSGSGSGAAGGLVMDSSFQADPSSPTSASITHPTAAAPPNTLSVAHMLARKKEDYIHILRLIHRHARQLQSLTLDNFGSSLQDEFPATPTTTANDYDKADASQHPTQRPTPLRFSSILTAHACSLTSLSLIGCHLRCLEITPDFMVLESLNLSKCKQLQQLTITNCSSLLCLDVSRSYLNDWDLKEILKNVPRLRSLNVASCKNIRATFFQLPVPSLSNPPAPTPSANNTTSVGSNRESENGATNPPPSTPAPSIPPQLRLVDLSNTSVIDSSVNGLLQHCRSLQTLFLNDCFSLHQPKIVSASLRSLIMRQCTRLQSRTQIICPKLKHLDLSGTNIRDEMINPTEDSAAGGAGDGSGSSTQSSRAAGQIDIPQIEVLLLKNCFELVEPIFHNSNHLWLSSRASAGRRGTRGSSTMRRSTSEGDCVNAAEAAGCASPTSPSPSASPIMPDSPSASSSSSASSNPTALPLQLYPHLTLLDLSSCYSLTNAALYHLLEMSPHIKSLNLSNCTQIRSRWREGGGGGADVTGMDEGGGGGGGRTTPPVASPIPVGDQAQLLRAISESSSHGSVGDHPQQQQQVRPGSSESISRSPDGTSSSSSSSDENNHHDDEDRAELFPPNLMQLEELCLNGCSIDDTNLSLLLNSSSMAPPLHTLLLRNCSLVSGRDLSGSLLRELDLRGCSLLSDSTLAEILANERCPALKILHVSQCSQLHHSSINHPVLRSLNISHCHELRSLTIAAPSLRRLDASCNMSLSQLDLSGCTSQLCTLLLHHSSAVSIVPPTGVPAASLGVHHHSSSSSSSSGKATTPLLPDQNAQIVLTRPSPSSSTTVTTPRLQHSNSGPSSSSPSASMSPAMRSPSLSASSPHRNLTMSRRQSKEGKTEEKDTSPGSAGGSAGSSSGSVPHRRNSSGHGSSASGRTPPVSPLRRGIVIPNSSSPLRSGVSTSSVPLPTALSLGPSVASTEQQQQSQSCLVNTTTMASSSSASHPTTVSASSDSSSSSSSESMSRLHRACLSFDLCLHESRIGELEMKLQQEMERHANLLKIAHGRTAITSTNPSATPAATVSQQSPSKSSTTTAADASLANLTRAQALSEAKSSSMTCYGLKRQLAVQRAKLRRAVNMAMNMAAAAPPVPTTSLTAAAPTLTTSMSSSDSAQGT